MPVMYNIFFQSVQIIYFKIELSKQQNKVLNSKKFKFYPKSPLDFKLISMYIPLKFTELKFLTWNVIHILTFLRNKKAVYF